ncbi:MAG: hypothetical protein IPN94_24310 [Sphingobacteriales bacterium]|nr:hypothetical protein [Sphingobacteriales bacterium]
MVPIVFVALQSNPSKVPNAAFDRCVNAPILPLPVTATSTGLSLNSVPSNQGHF